MSLKQLCAELEAKIVETYEEGVTMEEAERLAARFLHAQMQLSDVLKSVSLDASMKKTGGKAIRAAAYLEGATKGDKKPSDTLLLAQVDLDDSVQANQNALDEALAEEANLTRYYNIFSNAHIYYRNVGKNG